MFYNVKSIQNPKFEIQEMFYNLKPNQDLECKTKRKTR